MDNANSTESKALIDLGRELGKPFPVSDRNQVIIIPDGFTAVAAPFVPIAPLPDHVVQRVTLYELESFTAYVKRYQKSETLVFVQTGVSGATFEAVFDYHQAEKDGGDQVQHCSHIAEYPCPHSKEWQAWAGNNAKAMSQDAFAKFLDDNSVDITAPDSATLLEIVQDFEASINVDFSAKITPKTGAKTLLFTETVEGGGKGTSGKLDVPDEITLSLPVFQGGKLFQVTARIRFRIASGKLSLWYELRRPHTVIESAVKDIVSDVIASTGITPLAGSID